jgi:glutaredoxin 3
LIQNADALTAQVTMYATDWCPFCVRAEKLLVSKGANVKKINVEEQPDRRAEMVEMTGRRTVPQIFIGDRHVGGHDDLVALERVGDLDALLKNIS